jgi:predicted RecA/RadA family phage recombinase
MAATPIQTEGRFVQVTVAGAAQTRGDIVIVNNIVGVAMLDKALGATDQILDTSGVYRFDKAAVAFAVGERVYYNAGLDQATNNAADVFIGVAIVAVAGGAATVDVLLLRKYQYTTAEALAAAKAGMTFSAILTTVTTAAGAGAAFTGFRAPVAATIQEVRLVDRVGVAADAADTVQITLQNLTTAQAVATWDTTVGVDGALVANTPTADILIPAQNALAAGDVLSLIVAKTAGGQVTTELTAQIDYLLD